tara:strand:- start:425 stop:1057 length:633 start_codon:yes stop_codon:yes gene_type:complete
MQPRWKDPMDTPEGELLAIVKELEKNIGCSDYSDHGAETADYKSDRGQKAPPELPKSKKQKHNKPKKGEDDKMGSTCKTTEFLREKGIVVKYEQEPSVENSVPTFMDHSGGTAVEAINYHTNQTIPDWNDVNTKKTFITEKAKIPSVSQTGYDEKGSSLHMHLNDKGGTYQWNAPITDAMMQLKKAGGYGNPGLVEEIASELEVLMGRLS